MDIQAIKHKIIPILKNQGVIKAAVFGSYVTGEAKQDSDIDLLIDLADSKSLLDLAGLKIELEDILKKKVDLVTYDAIYPPLKNIILNEQQVIYEKRS